MTIDQAIRILDPATTLDELAKIEYYGGFHGSQMVVDVYIEACETAVKVMRKYQKEKTT